MSAFQSNFVCCNSHLIPDGAEARVEHCDACVASLPACKYLPDAPTDIINQEWCKLPLCVALFLGSVNSAGLCLMEACPYV